MKTMNKFQERLKNSICNNDIEFLKVVINEENINLRLEDDNNDSLLLFAISDYGSEMYKFLIERGADVFLKNDENENILHCAIYSNDVCRLEYVLNNFSINLNDQTKDGLTPLLLALLIGNNEMFNLLLQKNANVNIPDFENNYPIHVACQYGDIEIVKSLVQRNSLLNVKTNKGNYPFSLAVNNEHVEIVKYLYPIIYNNLGI